MRLTQEYVDNLTVEVREEISRVTYQYVVQGNRGIYNSTLKATIIKLNSILQELLDFIIQVEEGFPTDTSPTYILQLESEFRKYCNYSKNKSQTTVIQNSGDNNGGNNGDNSGGIGNFSQYLFDLPILDKDANEKDSDIILPITPEFIDVRLARAYALVIGDGEKDKDCYFSNDGGSTAKATADIAENDKLFLNLQSLGFATDATDQIEILIIN